MTTQLRDYDLSEPLGQGGMAAVWRATHRPTGARVALKRMLPHVADSDVSVARFIREVEHSATLRHQNVVSVHGFGTDDDGQWFLALEFCDAGTLVSLLKRCPKVPPPLVALMLDQLLAGLEAAHAQGIIHRDLKPANILLTTAGLIKIADFGIARSNSDQTLTATGEVIGTPAYMSPEQALGDRSLDARSDLFSLGMLGYRLLVGTNPYASEHVATSILRVTTGPDLKLGDALTTAAPLLESVVNGLVIKDRDRRLASATAARQMLAPFLSAVDGSRIDAMRRFIADPEGESRAVLRAASAHELAAARAALPAAPPRAFIFAHRACELDPTHAEARALLGELIAQHGFTVTVAHDPRVAAVRTQLETNPDDAALWRKLANLARGARAPLEAARALKRYVAHKPDDLAASHQLEELLGTEHVVALKTGASPALSTRDIGQGIKTGGFVGAQAIGKASTTQAPRGAPATPQGTWGSPSVIAADAPSDSTSWSTIVIVVGVVVALGLGGISMVRTLIKKGDAHVDTQLRAVEQLGAPLQGLVDGTQAPFLERAQQSARIADWQGALDAANFGLSADPDLQSRTSPQLLIVRAQARAQLGDRSQALIDARLGRSLTALDSVERARADEVVAALERSATPAQPPALSPAAPQGTLAP